MRNAVFREKVALAADFFKKASRSAPTASLRQQYAIYAGRNYVLSQMPEEALETLQPLLEEEELDFQTRSEVQSLVASAEVMRGKMPGV